MNEITKIHLGRQPFTISVDAHKALKEYLDAISHRVGPTGKDVVEEVELRIAELLAERGVKGDKVVLLADVDYIKEQLGKPGDFSDDADNDAEDDEPEDNRPKRLFRDPEHGMVAGVAAGLATFLKVDAVFVRLAFVLLVFLWGWGIGLYIVLWLIVPELKTKSDRLRSQGKAITVDSLKSLVERADVPGATGRIVKAIRTVVRSGWRALVILLSAVFVVAGAAGLLGITTVGSYLLLGPDQASLRGIFLVNGTEILAVVLALLAAGIVCVTLLLIGVAEVKRRQVIPGWVAAVMLGVFLISLSVGVALTPGIVQDVRSRYDAAHHISKRSVQPFKSLHVLSNTFTQVVFVPSDEYSVEMGYFGNTDPKLISTLVPDGLLTIDPEKFVEAARCKTICLYNDPFIKITVRAPEVQKVEIEGGASFMVTGPLQQSSLTLVVNKGAYAQIAHVHPSKVEWITQPYSSTDTLTLSNLLPDATEDDSINLVGMLSVSRTNELSVVSQGNCDANNGTSVSVVQVPAKITINDKVFGSVKELQALQASESPSAYNCVTIEAAESEGSMPAYP